MKEKIHPQYGKATAICSCGNTFETGSVIPKIHVEICSACHPFYTGKKRLVDTTGRVDRFKKRMEKSEKILADKMARTKKRKKPAEKISKSAVKKKAVKKK